MSETKNLAEALAAFQAELPRLGKGNTADAGTFKYKYADLANVSAVVLPLLGRHGLSFSAKPTLDEGRFVLRYALRHSCGDEDVGIYPLPASGSPQQIGSAITYARRYALSAVTGIAPDDDDDGKEAAQQWQVASEEDQAATADGFALEIEHARDFDSLTATLKTAQRSKANKNITGAQYERLFKQATVRRHELEGNEPAAVSAVES